MFSIAYGRHPALRDARRQAELRPCLPLLRHVQWVRDVPSSSAAACIGCS